MDDHCKQHGCYYFAPESTPERAACMRACRLASAGPTCAVIDRSNTTVRIPEHLITDETRKTFESIGMKIVPLKVPDSSAAGTTSKLDVVRKILDAIRDNEPTIEETFGLTVPSITLPSFTMPEISWASSRQPPRKRRPSRCDLLGEKHARTRAKNRKKNKAARKARQKARSKR